MCDRKLNTLLNRLIDSQSYILIWIENKHILGNYWVNIDNGQILLSGRIATITCNF